MIITEQKLEELRIAVLPLMAWLAANCHPHVACLVTSEASELLEPRRRTFAPRVKPPHPREISGELKLSNI
jgi:hypothetical protein